MNKQHNLKIAVEHFGPITEGEFELKPLTVFIGPNNSGKSYTALLVHTLSQALWGRIHGAFVPRVAWHDIREDNEYLREYRRAMFRMKKTGQESLLVRDLPEKLQKVLLSQLDKRFALLKEDIEEAFRDYFGCESVGDLVQERAAKAGLSVRINDQDGKSFISLFVGPDKESGILEKNLPDIGPMSVLSFRDTQQQLLLDDESPDFGYYFVDRETFPRLAPTRLWSALLKAYGIHKGNTYYLPAARSGILQGWQVLASMAVGIVRSRLGLERIEVPPLTGVAGDFLQILWERLFAHTGWREETRKLKVKSVLEMLEGQIFHGEVSVDKSRAERPLILYKSGPLKLPLQRTSSMVAELAPLDLWIKHLLVPGDLLIIDEPESHLHPENQRRIATVMVRLVRAGVRVLCTTHSSLILHQVSNHILASEAKTEVRRKLGISKDDIMSADEVGAYHFKLSGEGSQIKKIPIEPGFGIPEDEFAQVSEAIGEETYHLSLSHN